MIGIVLAFIGLVYFFSPSVVFLFTLWQFIVYSGFAIVYGSFDSYVYLLPVCMSLSVWIGMGTARIMDFDFRGQYKPGLAFSFIALIYLFGLAAYHWPRVDASRDLRAENFGQQVLESVPQNAIVFAEGDRAVFTLWYFHFALQKRSDLIIVADDLLHFDWYQENLHVSYPSLEIDESSPWPETLIQDSPNVPVCYVRYIDQTVVDCR
ncbi:hypothetical protein EHM76_03155 [bacterium]|nr:MAG: hypothetical protein EHM76_03155 [bacterium]